MHPKLGKFISICATMLVWIGLLLPFNTYSVLAAGLLTRISVDSSGVQANGSSRRSQISGDGRFVVFESDAINLAGGGGGLFLKDRQSGVITRISADGENASISIDGRFVAYDSSAKNLVNGDTNDFADIFVYDRTSELTSRVSVDSTGIQANGDSSSPSISDNGRFVAFQSDATNLVSSDENGASDIFVHDNQTGVTERISLTSDGAGANGGSSSPSISADGTIVVFVSTATNLDGNDTNNKKDAFARNRLNGATTRISVNSSGVQADGGGSSPRVSGDGRYVVFLSASGNLDPRADEYISKELVYVHDRQIGQTTLASVYSEGTIMTVGLFDQPTISRDGRYVAFSFYDKGDNNGIMNIWVRDLQTGASIKVANGNASSSSASLSADGKVVAFSSNASNLINGDTNGTSDVFVSDVSYGPERSPTVASATPDCGFSTPQCPFPSNASITFIVTFSEQVSGVTIDDFSLDVVEGGITGASISGVSGYGAAYFVTVDTGTGEGRLRLNVLDNDSIKDTVPNPLGGVGVDNGKFTTGKPYKIDKNSPAVVSIVRVDPNPSAASELHFIVNFSEEVYSVRSTDFVLTPTGDISGAVITAISPREDQYTASKIYTVTVSTGTGNGTLRLDLIDTDSIIDNDSPHPLGGDGASNGDYTTGEIYTVDKSTPSIPNVTSSLRVNTNPTDALSLSYTVTFSEAVNGVDPSDFSLAATGSMSGALVTNVSGSGNTYTITVSTGNGDGELRLNIVDDDSILNAANIPLGGSGAGNGNFTLGEAYIIHKTVPVVHSSLRADPNPTSADSVRFNVTFSEAVSGVDSSDFILTTTDSLASASILTVSGSANTYTVTAATGSSNGTLRLDLIDNDSILDSFGHPLGGQGAANGNFTVGDVYTVKKITLVSATESFRSTGARDGWILEKNENSNIGGSKNSNAAFIKLGDDAQDRQVRSILHFPTYYLPDNAVVTQVILMLKRQDVIGTDPFTTHQNISVDIRKGLFSSYNFFTLWSLQLTDFQAPADVYSVGTIQNNPVSGWYWTMLDARAFQNINLTDITQIRLGFQLDDNDDMSEDSIRFFSGDDPDQLDRPHLQIEYYVPR